MLGGGRNREERPGAAATRPASESQKGRESIRSWSVSRGGGVTGLPASWEIPLELSLWGTSPSQPIVTDCPRDLG